MWSLTLVLCLSLLGAAAAVAQTATTGSLAGVVTDAQGGALPGATVTAVHTPTGTSYEAVTDGEGRYQMLNVRVGPYTVVGEHGRLQEDGAEGHSGRHSASRRRSSSSCELESVTETVEVRGQSSIIDSSRAGTADNISTHAVENLPTIARSLTDIARTSPYFNPMGLNNDPLALSVAGRNNRYNNVQIDGAVNNDVFGLSPSGTPGGVTEAQPISLDAIQELQLVVSPYDVRQGGFSGGGINAITKSGTNAIKGTGYFFGRNQDWVGESPTGTKVGKFKDQQFGGSLGGPIAQEPRVLLRQRRLGAQGQPVGCLGQRQRPAVRPRGGNPAVPRTSCRTRYNYNPGATDEFIRAVNSDKVFVRGDFNLDAAQPADGAAQLHQGAERHRLPDASPPTTCRTTSTGSGTRRTRPSRS